MQTVSNSTYAPDIRGELQKVASDAQYKRKKLFTRAQKRESWRRRMQVISGAVTLLSGVVTSLIFYNEVGDRWVQILSVTFIFVAGMISIFMDALLMSKDTDAMFRGASEFLSLRDRAEVEEKLNFDDVNRMKKSLKEFRSEYGSLCAKYDHLIQMPFSSTDHRTAGARRIGREEWGRTQREE